MIAFETSVGIERPLAEVFAYVSDPRTFPEWNSAVQAMRPTSRPSNEVGSTYSMERRLPTGSATNELQVVTSERSQEFAIRTIAGPTPFFYRYRFVADSRKTLVHLDAQVELPGLAAVVPQLARRSVKKGVDDNLARLKLKLEARSG